MKIYCQHDCANKLFQYHGSAGRVIYKHPIEMLIDIARVMRFELNDYIEQPVNFSFFHFHQFSKRNHTIIDAEFR